MLRSLLVILLAALALSDDVEIVDDEPIAPTIVEPETFDAEGEFKGAENMNALLSFVDPPLGFVRPTSPASIVAGKVCKFVVSLENSATTGPVHYSLYTLEAALHYPHYYGYHIQNFTTQVLQNTLEPGQQASLFYSFTPSVQLAGQHFDFAVILTYHDQSGRPYFHSLFNATIALLEDDEGMDTEIIFLTLLVLAITALVAFALWTWISSKALKRSNKVEPNRNIDGTSENKYLTPTKKISSPSKPERSDGSVKRRQGKK